MELLRKERQLCTLPCVAYVQRTSISANYNRTKLLQLTPSLTDHKQRLSLPTMVDIRVAEVLCNGDVGGAEDVICRDLNSTVAACRHSESPVCVLEHVAGALLVHVLVVDDAVWRRLNDVGPDWVQDGSQWRIAGLPVADRGKVAGDVDVLAEGCGSVDVEGDLDRAARVDRWSTSDSRRGVGARSAGGCLASFGDATVGIGLPCSWILAGTALGHGDKRSHTPGELWCTQALTGRAVVLLRESAVGRTIFLDNTDKACQTVSLFINMKAALPNIPSASTLR